MQQREFERNGYPEPGSSRHWQEDKNSDASPLAIHEKNNSGLTAGSVAGLKKIKEDFNKQKILNIKQGKAYNEKMVKGIS